MAEHYRMKELKYKDFEAGCVLGGVLRRPSVAGMELVREEVVEADIVKVEKA